jgi:Fe2+ or Zn2+ uptake regulation protein
MTADLATELRSRGHRVTPQRLMIHRALVELGRHASAEEVLERVDLPTASLPTVYATLDLLAELGFARRISARSGATLYDPRVVPHHHLVCRRCGAIEDLDAQVDTAGALRAARRKGFRPADAELVVSGLCSSCAG